ncbi:FHA domain-containing protein [Calothrix sp. NIES-4071]|nr:FHA domain-containing protein [Calothrix sp. NIES-4071]BAZ61713.1 FHA domain-containing protein [Calothrix sp. NIES-4105]
MPECVEAELEQRLCLYQTFLKLYEQHGSLLDEILELETFHSSITGVKSFYLQGIIDNSAVYVTTNLCQGETLSLKQPQHIWTLGRGVNSGIHILDSYVSRCHAAIQYVECEQKFYLIDFNSSNGSYVNGEQIFKQVELKDGDHIRLGNTTFDFFLNVTTRILPAVSLETLMLLSQESTEVVTTKNIYQHESANLNVLEGTGYEYLPCITGAPSKALHFEQSQEIVDYFLSKK